jgi:hypothetical protein
MICRQARCLTSDDLPRKLYQLTNRYQLLLTATHASTSFLAASRKDVDGPPLRAMTVSRTQWALV